MAKKLTTRRNGPMTPQQVAQIVDKVYALLRQDLEVARERRRYAQKRPLTRTRR